MHRGPFRREASWLLLVAVVGSVLVSASSGAIHAPPATFAVPQILVLQPDAANGTDTWMLDATPAWNYGDNGSLRVGPNASNGSLARSLLRFDLASLPPNATLVNATLALYAAAGTGGAVDVHRAQAPWTEGAGGRSWVRQPILVRETAGVPRVREPVLVDLTFAPNSITDPARDLRIYNASAEVPSQIYRYVRTGGAVTGARLVFEVSLGANQARWYNVTYSTNGTAVPAYRMKTWSAAPLWTSPSLGSGSSGATVADIDGDGRLEVIVGGADGFLYFLNETLAVRSQIRIFSSRSIPYPPQVADLDRDGTLDIVLLTNDPAIVRLTNTGGVVWARNYTNGNIPNAPPTLVDVNGDGVLDVLVSGKTNTVEALDGRNGALIRTFAGGGTTFAAAVADANGDGSAEVFFGSDNRQVYAYNVGGAFLWSAPANTSFIESHPSIGDVNADGVLDVVDGADANAGPEFALRATDGASVWFSGVNDFLEGGQTLADINGDGRLEVLTSDFTGGTIYAMNGITGRIIWRYASGETQPLTPAVADLDKDGTPEIVFISRTSQVLVFNTTGSLVRSWTITANNPGLQTLAQLPIASPALADLDGDGTLEVIVPTGTGVQAFGTGGLDHDWRTWGYNWNHTSRAADGASPTGAPFLLVSFGSSQVIPSAGASWVSRNGVTSWAMAGGDFGPAEASAPGVLGWMGWNVTPIVSDWFRGTYPNIGFVVIEANEATGTLHVFMSSDSPVAAERPRLTITYTTPVLDSDPHIVRTIPDITRLENSPPYSVNLQSYAQDNDTPLSELRWNVTGYDPAVVQITGLNTPGNHILTITPLPNQYGDALVTYWLTDPQGHFARQDAWIRITRVNAPPSFAPPPTLFVRYNRTYVFDYGPYISDPDTPRSQLTFTSDDPIGAVVSDFNVSYRYPESLLNQWVFVTLTVGDGQYTVAKVVAVKVTADDPPVLSRPIPDLTMYEGEFRANVFNLGDYFSDPNNDALYYAVGATRLTVTIHANHSVDVLAQAEWWGTENVTFRARDPMGAIAEDTILVTVIPVNDPPVIGPVPDLRVRYDEPYSFNLEPYLNDPDTPIDRLVVTTSDLHVYVSQHLLTILYPQVYNGTVQNVTLTVSDGLANASRTIRIAIGDDHPPLLLNKLGGVSFPEDTVLRDAYNLASFFADPDGDALYYSSGNRSVLITIRTNGSVDLSALSNWFGTERVTFRATDSQGALAEDTVWITVLPVDDAPFVRPIPEQFLNATAGYLDLSAYLGDVDNNVSDLTLSVSGNPHVSVIGQGLLFSYQADATETIQIVVSDGVLTNTTTFVLVVTLPPPTIEIPSFLYWLPIPAGLVVFAAFALYRRRQIEWAFLVTDDGLLVCSMSRGRSTNLDTDLMTGMLTTILDFARKSFSDETERNLEGLTLGDRKVAIVRGDVSYLAVVYSGRTPGSLTHIMASLLRAIETRHRDALGDIIDTSKLTEIPGLLQKLVKRGWWPLLRFDDGVRPTDVSGGKPA